VESQLHREHLVLVVLEHQVLQFRVAMEKREYQVPFLELRLPTEMVAVVVDGPPIQTVGLVGTVQVTHVVAPAAVLVREMVKMAPVTLVAVEEPDLRVTLPAVVVALEL
jgi:hypothetical protein